MVSEVALSLEPAMLRLGRDRWPESDEQRGLTTNRIYLAGSLT